MAGDAPSRKFDSLKLLRPPVAVKTESWSLRMKGPRLMMWWMVKRHFRATWESVVRWRRVIREWIRVEAVARELSPRVRRVVRWWLVGGVDGEWEVARRTAR